MDVAKTRHSEFFAAFCPVFPGPLAAFAAAGFTKNYALACFDQPEITPRQSPGKFRPRA
jgi:hypothetical protein